MGNNGNLLSSLRDIHLPDPSGWWPPAPGWWLVACLLIAASLLLITWIRRVRARTQPRRLFRSRLEQIIANQTPDAEKAREISALLKSFLIARFGREKIARLQGEDWVAFLDTTTAGGNEFSLGPGSALASAQYLPDGTLDTRALGEFLHKWSRSQ